MLNECPTRREMIKTLLWSSVLAIVGGRVSSQSLAGEVRAAASLSAGSLKLKISDFPALAQAGGSIRLGSSLIGPKKTVQGLFPPVTVNRGPGNEFFAFDARCPHEGCVVGTYKPALGLMVCPCHGSKYRLDGSYVSGPANASLVEYPVTNDDNGSIIIQIDEMTFDIAVEPMPTAAGGRLRISFLAFEEITYEVRFKPFSGSESRVLPFALSADSSEWRDSLRLTSTPDDNTLLFIDPPTENGLIQVAIQMRLI